MTTVRKWLSSIHQGRIVFTKADGSAATADELRWMNTTITRQLKTDHMVETKGYRHSAALVEPDVIVGTSRKTGQVIAVHPLLHQLKHLISKRQWVLGTVSMAIGKRDSALSEWFRGLMKPTLVDVNAAYALLGYRLMAVPASIAANVEAQVEEAERELMRPIDELNVRQLRL